MTKLWVAMLMAGSILAAAPVAAKTAMTPAAAAVASPDRPAEDSKRDADRKPADLVRFAGIKRGQVVADIMPGGGYFTRIFSKLVGPKGKVLAAIPEEFTKRSTKGAPRKLVHMIKTASGLALATSRIIVSSCASVTSENE